MSEQNKQPDWWDHQKSPHELGHTTVSDAVEAWAHSNVSIITPDHTLEVYGYARPELPSAQELADTVLEDTLERLHEEYTFEDNDGFSDPHDIVKGKALELAQAIRDNFTVTVGHPVETRTVRVGDYLDAEWFND